MRAEAYLDIRVRSYPYAGINRIRFNGSAQDKPILWLISPASQTQAILAFCLPEDGSILPAFRLGREP